MLTPVLAVCMLGAFDVRSVGSLDVTPTAMVAIKGVLYLGTASGDVVQADLGEVPPVIATTATGAGIFAMAHVVVDDDTQYLVVSPADAQYGIRIHPLNTTDGSLQAPRMMVLSRTVTSLSVVGKPLSGLGQVLVVAECETYEAVSSRCSSPSIISTYLLAVSPLTAGIWPPQLVSFTTDNFAVRSREPGIERNGLVYFGGRSLNTTWGAVVAVNVASGSVHSVLEEAVGHDTEPWIAFAGDQLLCAAYHKWAYINVFSMQDAEFGKFQYAVDLTDLTRLFSIDVVGEFVYLSGRNQGLLRVPLSDFPSTSTQSVTVSMQSAVVLSGDLTALLEDMGVFYCVIVGDAKTTVEAYAVSAPPSAQPNTLAPSTLVPEADQCSTSLLLNPDFAVKDVADATDLNNALWKGNVSGWQASHGTPSLFAAINDTSVLDHSVWMWSYSGKGEGIFADATFTKNTHYHASMWVRTNPETHPGSFYVKLANGLHSDGGKPPSVASQQTVYTGGMVFTNATVATFNFTADADFSQLWIYPNWTGTDQRTQAELRVGSVMVCAETTEVPQTWVPPVPVTETAVPCTETPGTETPRTVPAAAQCSTSIVKNPDFAVKDLADVTDSSQAIRVGNITGWEASHGSPSVLPALDSASALDHSAWMWSHSGVGEGMFTAAAFSANTHYHASMWVVTNPETHPGSFYVKLANGLHNETTWVTPKPSVASQQTVYTGGMVFTNVTVVTFNFTADADFSQLWIYPNWTGTDQMSQAELRVGSVMVCAETTEVPQTWVPPVPVTETAVLPRTETPGTNTPGPETPADSLPNPECAASLVENPTFDPERSAPEGAESVPGWSSSHGTPTLFGMGTSYRMWMWSHSGMGEGIFADATFTKNTHYHASMWVRTNPETHPGSFYVKLANGLHQSTSLKPPSVASQQTVYTGGMVFTNATVVTFNFTADADFSQLWIYPNWTGTDQMSQAELSVDNVVVCNAASTATPLSPSNDSYASPHPDRYPSESPTLAPIPAPTLAPTQSPTLVPILAPTLVPTTAPTAVPTTPTTPAPTTCTSLLIANPTFTTESNASDAVSTGLVPGWHSSHGSPALLPALTEGAGDEHSVWLWAHSGLSAGIIADAVFAVGVQYRAYMQVETSSTQGTFSVRLANGVIPTTSSPVVPVASSEQTVFISEMAFPNATTVTFTFIAEARYTQLWVYPSWGGGAFAEAEMRVGGLQVCGEGGGGTEMPSGVMTVVPAHANGGNGGINPAIFAGIAFFCAACLLLTIWALYKRQSKCSESTYNEKGTLTEEFDCIEDSPESPEMAVWVTVE